MRLQGLRPVSGDNECFPRSLMRIDGSGTCGEKTSRSSSLDSWLLHALAWICAVAASAGMRAAASRTIAWAFACVLVCSTFASPAGAQQLDLNCISNLTYDPVAAILTLDLMVTNDGTAAGGSGAAEITYSPPLVFYSGSCDGGQLFESPGNASWTLPDLAVQAGASCSMTFGLQSLQPDTVDICSKVSPGSTGAATCCSFAQVGFDEIFADGFEAPPCNACGQAFAVVLIGQPASGSNIPAGNQIPLTARVVDDGYNPIAGQTVDLTVSSGPGGLSGAAGAVTDANGEAAFNVSINAAGSYKLSAVDATTPAARTATSNTFNVVATVAKTTTFATQPSTNSNLAAGSAIPVTAHVTDAYGNPVPGQNVQLAVGVNPGGSVLSVAANPAQTNASGDAAFSGVSLNKTGSGYRLTATDQSTPSATAAISNPFNIVAGTPSMLVFIQQPTDSVAGLPITPAVTVSIRDGSGNSTGSSAAVTIAIGANPGGSTLSGTLTTNAVAGVATFSSLALDRGSAGYTLAASSPGLTAAASNTFTVTDTCKNLAKISYGAGNWVQQSAGPVTYGDGTTSATYVDFTKYTSVWNEGASNNQWPGASGFSVRLGQAALAGAYVAERFTVPADGSVSGTVTWRNNSTAAGYSAVLNAASYSVSLCSGDFGQPGTQLGASCSADIASSGLAAKVSSTPQPGFCTLVPGGIYYLNAIPASIANAAANPVTSNCGSSCAPWTVRQ